MCCQRNGYSSAFAACTAALTVSASRATRMMRRSSSSEATSVTAWRGVRNHSRRASETPALAGPLPRSGGTCAAGHGALCVQRDEEGPAKGRKGPGSWAEGACHIARAAPRPFALRVWPACLQRAHPPAISTPKPSCPAPTSSSMESADRPSSMAGAGAPGGASARLMRSTEMGAAL